MTATETRPSVADVTRAALAFVEAHSLDLPELDVSTNSPGTRGWDPQDARPASTRDTVPVPPGEVSIAFVRSGPAFVAWCRALGATRVIADRSQSHATRVGVHVWRDGIRWRVVGLLPHEHGAPHLPGAGVEWSTGRDRNLGAVTVDGLAAIYAAEAAP